MKLAFLYAGQGSQTPGMGKDFYDSYEEYREVFAKLPGENKLRYYMEKASMEELTLTENTQPCMAAFAAGVTNILRKNGIVPDVACGLSLGEYGALHAAGILDAATYVSLAAYRGSVMAEAAKDHECSMSAILGLSVEMIEKACTYGSSFGFVTLANANCPGQSVICGEEKGVQAAETYAKEQGAKRCIRLQVGGPFHTKYMQPAAEKLRVRLESVTFSKPLLPVVLNVNAEYLKDVDSLREILPMQMQSCVRMEESLRRLLEDGTDTFVEIGPGNVVSGFVKKTAKAMKKEITVYSIQKAADLEKIWSLKA